MFEIGELVKYHYEITLKRVEEKKEKYKKENYNGKLFM